MVFEIHLNKHYALWKSLLNKSNKEIIKEQLLMQIKKNIKIKNNKIMSHGILEFLEYENRQTKFVNNCQRIYDFYDLKWQLPLWDKSFITFWSSVPLKYKLHQKLYKDALSELNMGKVWGEDCDFKFYITPSWVRVLRIMLKACFLFSGKNKWHKFDKKYLSYWTDNICGQSIFPYNKVIKNRNGIRHYVSLHTIRSEELNLNSNWQNIKIGKDI